MGRKLVAGDTVAWQTSQGETSGKVVKKVTSRAHVKGHVVSASPSEPQYLVESRKTGARAAHKPSALKKKK